MIGRRAEPRLNGAEIAQNPSLYPCIAGKRRILEATFTSRKPVSWLKRPSTPCKRLREGLCFPYPLLPHVRTAPDAYRENNYSYKPAQTNSFGTNMGSHAPSYSNSYSR